MLLPEDYESLRTQGLTYEEVPASRFLIFKDFPLPSGLYNASKADILVVLANNYPDGGHDMFWTHPHLSLQSGVAIPNIEPNGVQSPQNHNVGSTTYYRWSRHWNEPQNSWIPGKNNVNTIIRRLICALNDPLLKNSQ